MRLTCLCGGASVEIARLPDFVFECNCTLCIKSGPRWGYFAPEEVTPSGETRSFRRADKADPASQIHFCPDCGVTTHFTLAESAIARFGNTMAGVNMALADEADLAGIELRFPDGKSWNGEGEFTFVREPRVLGGADPSQAGRRGDARPKRAATPPPPLALSLSKGHTQPRREQRAKGLRQAQPERVQCIAIRHFRHPGLDPGSRFPSTPAPQKRDPGSSPG